jgi:hypothetical protein
MRTALMAVLALIVFVFPASAQTTHPAEELAKENAELKKRIEKLEAYVAELEAKVQPSKRAPRAQVVPPFRPAPYAYELPAPPFKVPTPAPTPLPKLHPTPPGGLPVIPPSPRYDVPGNWQKREFNGQEYYLVPLR